MNCECISELEAKVRDRVQLQLKAQIESVQCGSMGFILDESAMRHELFVPFVIKADVPRYRGKGYSMRIYASYCPFCGKSTRPEQKAA